MIYFFFFFRGLLKLYPRLVASTEEKCEEFAQKHKFCVNCLSLLVDIYVGKGEDDDLQKAVELVAK